MPPHEADDIPYVFDHEGARRIVSAVRWVESRPKNLRRELPAGPGLIPQAIWLAQNSAFQLPNTSATTWTVYAGTTAGSETATQLSGLSVYLRKGIVFSAITYLVVEVCGRLEVLNPSMSFLGKNTGGATAHNGSTNANVYTGTPGFETDSGQNVTGIVALMGSIAANAMLWVYFNESYSGGGARWYAIETDTCP